MLHTVPRCKYYKVRNKVVWEFIHSFNKYLLGVNVAVNKINMVPAHRELIHITFPGSTRKQRYILAWPSMISRLSAWEDLRIRRHLTGK